MSFVDAIRAILREAGEPLTSAEIRERIEAGYPSLRPADPGPYASVPHRVIARIGTAVSAARDIEKDTTVRPMLIRLVEGDEAADRATASVPEDDETDVAAPPPDEPVGVPARPLPAGPTDRFVLEWTRCRTYDEAKDHSEIIYLHEWDGSPFYWGIARTYFGGSRRPLNGRLVSGRYNSGYRHWIEGCLRHGARLYIAKIVAGDPSRLQEVENYLICTHGHEANRRETAIVTELDLAHRGDVPASVGRFVRQSPDRAA